MRLETSSRWKLPRRGIAVLAVLVSLSLIHTGILSRPRSLPIPPQCRSLQEVLDPAPGFTATRTAKGSDRFVPGTRATLIRNAKILTGERNGTEVVYGDVLLDKGVIIAVGYIPSHIVLPADLDVIDADGKWVSPGLVDAHSHLGVSAAPNLSGARTWISQSFVVTASAGSNDGNSQKAPILPWLRAVDGLNTHDDAYRLAVAGGVTTAQILPGSANNIGASWSYPSIALTILQVDKDS
jgi:hypothetical protein